MRYVVFTLTGVVIAVAVWLLALPNSSLFASFQITATPGPLPLGTALPDENTAPELDVDEPAPTESPIGNTPLPAHFIGPNSYPENVNPLTGLTVEDPTVLQRRPIVAKISNAPPLVRPQAGIGQADIVWEHYAEGGLTRFSAVFYSQTPQRVGSIRSGRLIDYELSPMYQALLVFSGGSTGVEEQIFGTEATGITEARLAEGREILPPSDFADRALKGVLYGPPYYFRDEDVPVPHNLFASPSDVWRLASETGINTPPNLRGLTFSSEIPVGEAGPASLVDVRYRATRAQWWYDDETGVYQRMSDGQWHTDSLTGEVVTAENVVIVFANHEFTDIVESEWQGNKSFSILVQLWFEGEAMVARDGRWYRARWVRPTRESILTLQTESGEVFPLKPGQTWFQAVRLPEQQQPESEWVIVE